MRRVLAAGLVVLAAACSSSPSNPERGDPIATACATFRGIQRSGGTLTSDQALIQFQKMLTEIQVSSDQPMIDAARQIVEDITQRASGSALVADRDAFDQGCTAKGL